MYLTEKKVFKKKVNRDLYKQLDDYSFKAKNLKNATNYLIKQCSRIGYKLIYKGFNESVERIAVCYPLKKRKTKTAA